MKFLNFSVCRFCMETKAIRGLYIKLMEAPLSPERNVIIFVTGTSPIKEAEAKLLQKFVDLMATSEAVLGRLVDDSIDAMTPEKLAQFRKDAAAIMEKSRNKEGQADGKFSQETES